MGWRVINTAVALSLPLYCHNLGLVLLFVFRVIAGLLLLSFEALQAERGLEGGAGEASPRRCGNRELDRDQERLCVGNLPSEAIDLGGVWVG